MDISFLTGSITAEFLTAESSAVDAESRATVLAESWVADAAAFSRYPCSSAFSRYPCSSAFSRYPCSSDETVDA